MTAPFEVPRSCQWFLGSFGHLYPGMQTVSKKKRSKHQLISCLFSKGIIITSKPKWDFCVKSYSLVSCRIINSFASVRKCVVQLITMQRQRNRHYFKWIQSKFRGKENFNLSLVKKNFLQEISCRNSKEIWSKSVRHLVRAVRSE